MRRRRGPAQELRTAIDCMPVETREAMLDALDVNPIIVGAYTTRDGGVCPMLAAHRNGGRTSFASFAHAWDRYTRAPARPRMATDREVQTLRTMLRASIAVEGVGDGDFDRAIADHRQAQVTRARREEHDVTAAPGWRDRLGLRDEVDRALTEIAAADAARRSRTGEPAAVEPAARSPREPAGV